jgi:hypothetical protein
MSQEQNPYKAPLERGVKELDDSKERVGTLICALYIIVAGFYLIVIASRTIDAFIRQLWQLLP